MYRTKLHRNAAVVAAVTKKIVKTLKPTPQPQMEEQRLSESSNAAACTLAGFLECYAKPAIPDFEAAWRRVDAPRAPAAGSAQLCLLPSVAVPSFARKRAPQPVERRASDHGRLDCVA